MIAIHTKSGSFAPEWVAYCQEHCIPYREVDCFSSDIIEQLRGCRALLWHWYHHDFRAQLFARQLIASIEGMGLHVFPDTATSWHYDDKVGQKYLLEAIGAPLIPTYVFYDRDSALKWVGQTSFPKVWKLRGGAGSQNVRLVRNAKNARRIIRKAFGSGWSFSRFHVLRERLWHFKRDRNWSSLVRIPRSLWWAVFPNETTRNTLKQKNYVYFQDFAPNNDCDIRIVTIGNRCYGFRRMTRDGDFRASGSGVMDHDPENIPKSCVETAFDVSRALDLQSAAYDFVRSGDDYLIVEVSYAFSLIGYRKCPGFWDGSLAWHDAPVTPERFMIEDLLVSIGMAR